MNALRTGFDKFYDSIKPVVFYLTRNDPEVAHTLFVNFSRLLHRLRLEKLVLDNPSNRVNPGFEISNAAGFNKNGEIPPSFLKYLGFDRVVVGTVTYEPWAGNSRPRTVRFPETESLVNWMGLPGVGAEKVAENLSSYRFHGVPITINLMSTPEKKGDEMLRDLENTMLMMRGCANVDRFELNVSCPNTKNESGSLDARSEYTGMLRDMIQLVEDCKYDSQEYDVKVSPDLLESDVDEIIFVLERSLTRAVVLTNSTTVHDLRYIPKSPGKGGATGNAGYERSLRVQRLFDGKIKQRGIDLGIVACGAINSLIRLRERLSYGARGVQIYTPLIFSGTKLLRSFRNYT